jgi:hypothetical protein
MKADDAVNQQLQGGYVQPNFGTLSLKLGDILTFHPTGEQYTVASEGGGTFVKPIDAGGRGPAMTLRLATRRLLGRPGPLDEGEDFWRYWIHNNHSLREHLDKLGSR